MSDNQVHMGHCFQGDYPDSCKYGEDDCPASLFEAPNPTSNLIDKRADIPGTIEYKVATYNDCYDDAKKLGYSSIEDALEALVGFQDKKDPEDA